MTETIKCIVHRCKKKDGMYLYLREGMEPEDLPEALLKLTGVLERSMTLTLSPERTLAREDVLKVMANLREQGFHLQMPPTLTPDLHYGD